jgi:hypothetical protein
MEIRFPEYAVKMPGIRELGLLLLLSRQRGVPGFALADGETLFPLVAYDLSVHSNGIVWPLPVSRVIISTLFFHNLEDHTLTMLVGASPFIELGS